MTPVRLERPAAHQSWGRVLSALMFRELLMRFGVYRLGLLWALIEPAAHVGVLLFIFGSAARSVLPVEQVIPFAFIGVCAYLAFRSGVERAGGSLESSRALLSFRQVTPAAMVLARSLVEQLTLTAVLAGGLAILSASVGLPWANPSLFFAAFACLSLLVWGCGLMVAVAVSFFPSVRKVIGFAMRGLYLVSGVLFPLTVLPRQWAEVLSWNPLLQAIEMMREGVLGRASHPSVSLPFLALCAVASVFLGLALMRVLHRELEPA